MVKKGHQVATKARREVFLRHLRTIGEGKPCVPWPWSDQETTYIRIAINGKFTSAHRWVFENVIGPIPEGMEVCHRCDNPPCVRPSHLFAGTHSQNILDAYAKGRAHGNTKNHVSGERHPSTKFTAEDIYRIRALSDAKVPHLRIAREYGVSHTAIGNIARRKVWRSLPEQRE